MMDGQSMKSVTLTGDRLRKAGRVTPGNRADRLRGAKARLGSGGSVPLRGGRGAFIRRSVIPSSSALLTWYDRNRRTLPWRALPGHTADPYHVWISEVMLQQTTVVAVIPYYERFLARFPTVSDLAQAPLDDVLAAWAGLGYYSRARNLHRCAQAVDALGDFPRDVEGLRALPGIGPYTAAAVAAIAFGVPVVPVDGNVERVTARLFAVEEPLPGVRRALTRLAETLNGEGPARERPSDFAQALFDLGAGLCTPRSPACVLCPWTDACVGRKQSLQGELPRRAPRATRPERFGAVFLLLDESGRCLLRRRPDKGLLGGTVELPGTEWRATAWPLAEARAAAPFADRWKGRGSPRVIWRHAGTVRHVFSHFGLTLEVYGGFVPVLPNPAPEDGFLVPATEAGALALSSLMRKCLTLALGEDVAGEQP